MRPEAGQGEPLEKALEAPLGRPGGLSREGRLLGAGVLDEATVGDQRLRAARGVVRGARPKRHLIEVLDGAGGPAGEQGLTDADKRLLALQRREVGGEEADPGGLLDDPRGRAPRRTDWGATR